MNLNQDQSLHEISMKMDEFILTQLKTYDIDPLGLSAIINARVFMFNESTGTINEYKAILEHVIEIQPEYIPPVTLQ